LLIDSLLSDVSSLVNKSLPEEARILFFSSIAVIATVSGIIAVHDNIRKVKAEVAHKNKSLLSLSWIMPYIQYTIIALLVLITLEIIFTHQFLNFFLVGSLALSWSTGGVLMGVLSYKLIQWYKAKRNSLVLLFAVASVMFCATLSSTIVPQILITIQTAPGYVNAHSTEVKPFQANPEVLSALFAIISVANWMVLPLWFIVWAATAVTLSHYSRKFGRVRYWVMLSVPLASVIIATLSWIFFLPSLSSIFDQKAIFYTMMAFGSILASGFLLSFAFMTISKTIEKGMHTKINDYLGISAIGVALVFVSFFANPSAGSYLPFGVLSASFFAFGAYLFFSGIYSSALSIGSDSGLRKSMRTSAIQQSKLLDSIGTAQMEQNIQDTVMKTTKEQEDAIREQTGIEPSLSEEDMKQYLKQVIEEVKKLRSNTTNRTK
jgi:hypothetical protein